MNRTTSASASTQLDYATVLASSIHDMKNSLGFLLGSLEQVAGQCNAGQCESALQIPRLQYEGKRVNDHLVQLLALYRMDTSQFLVTPDEHNVNEFLDEILSEHREMLGYRGISWKADCADDLDWFFDAELIGSVLGNVFNNLYLYARDAMRISASIEDEFLVIRVQDNGDGYPDNLLSGGRETGLDFRSGGTGLGLYFAHRAAALHRHRDRAGYVQLSNDGLDGGGCFSIFLP